MTEKKKDFWDVASEALKLALGSTASPKPPTRPPRPSGPSGKDPGDRPSRAAQNEARLNRELIAARARNGILHKQLSASHDQRDAQRRENEQLRSSLVAAQAAVTERPSGSGNPHIFYDDSDNRTVERQRNLIADLEAQQQADVSLIGVQAREIQQLREQIQQLNEETSHFKKLSLQARFDPDDEPKKKLYIAGLTFEKLTGDTLVIAKTPEGHQKFVGVGEWLLWEEAE